MSEDFRPAYKEKMNALYCIKELIADIHSDEAPDSVEKLLELLHGVYDIAADATAVDLAP